jgi:hypothetical protein
MLLLRYVLQPFVPQTFYPRAIFAKLNVKYDVSNLIYY